MHKDIQPSDNLFGDLLKQSSGPSCGPKGCDTEQYPNGRISTDDAGQSRLALTVDRANKLLVIAFEHPTPWMGLRLEEVRTLQEVLSKKIKELEELKTAEGN